jgi:hypothetical protein
VTHSFCHKRFKGNDIFRDLKAVQSGHAVAIAPFRKLAVFNGAGTFYKG